jgi:RNA polymerase sigma-70 factor (ECF subfamily)
MPSLSPQLAETTKVELVLKTHAGALRRFFSRRIRIESDIDDLIQDVYFRLLRRGGIQDISRVEPYIFRTANSVLRDYVRRRATHYAQSHECANDDLRDENPSPEHVLIMKENIAQFAGALLELPERTRIIFILSRVNKFDYCTIAGLQGISVSAVEKHIAKALAYLVPRVNI